MQSKRNNRLIGLSAVIIALLLSSNTPAAPRGGGRGPARGLGFGPPAHAPAYGYRSKVVCGYRLIFDSACGLYIVVGLTDCYYHEGHFYRWRAGVWEISLRADKWDPIARDKLPAAVNLKAKSIPKYNSPAGSDAKSNGPGKDHPKPNGNVKSDNGGSDAKLNAGGPSDPKSNAATDGKTDAKSNNPAKPNAAGSENKSGANAGGPAKADSATGATSNASGSNQAKSTGNGPAKPGGKAKSPGKGKR